MCNTKLPGSCHIDVVDWAEHQGDLKAIRQQVFIKEQNVPQDLEWDGLDETAIHLLARLEQQPSPVQAIGTARILIHGSTAHIGRMAVLKPWRGLGTGKKLLNKAIDECKKHQVKKIILNAQAYVLNFYQSAGFVISSNEFMDAGIAHREMTLNL